MSHQPAPAQSHVPADNGRWTPTPLQGVGVLYRVHYARLLTFARRLTGEVAANDVVHEAMLRYMDRARRGVAPVDPVEQEAVLFGLVRDVGSEHRRTLSRRERLLQLVTGPTPSMRKRVDAELPQKAAELAGAVEEILAQMPRRWAETFRLAYDHAAGYETIGALLGVSPAAARSNYAKACRVLRDELLARAFDSRSVQPT